MSTDVIYEFYCSFVIIFVKPFWRCGSDVASDFFTDEYVNSPIHKLHIDDQYEDMAIGYEWNKIATCIPVTTT